MGECRQSWCWSAIEGTFVFLLFGSEFLESISYMDYVIRANQLSENKLPKGRRLFLFLFFLNGASLYQVIKLRLTRISLFPESRLHSWLAFQ